MLLAVGGIGAAFGGFGLYTYYAKDLPTLDSFDEMTKTTLNRFEASDGQIVGEWSRERRLALQWSDLPRSLILGFLAAEDSRFFEHSGVDIQGVARAFITNIRAGKVKEGASTITQQLATTLVGQEVSVKRKVRQAILARRIEDLYDKTQILTWYANVIYLGHGSFGVQAASQNYFRKNVWELNLAEAAMIAGSAQSPGRVNAAINMPEARVRMRHVLGNMRKLDWITEAQEQEALAFQMRVYPLRDSRGDHVPYYTETVRKQVADRYRPKGGSWLDRGLTVSMMVDTGLQRAAQDALGHALEDLAKRQGYPGPLAKMSSDLFLAKNASFAPRRKGERGLGVVTEVSRRQARVELAFGLSGQISIDTTRWAGPYSELPRLHDGKPDLDAPVSFRPHLSDLQNALSPGDVIPVEVTAEAAADAGGATMLGLELVPLPKMEGALVSYNLGAGGVDTMVGGYDFDRSQVNRAYSVRQTGSTMKPIVYSKAYDLGLPPSALFSGAPFREGTYNPTGKKTKKDMLVWDALAKSENSVSLRVLSYVLNHTTLADYAAWGKRLGLPRKLMGHTSEILGADQTPLGIARAYGTFGRMGLRPDLTMIRKVVDANGRVLERNVSPMDADASLHDAWLGLWAHTLKPPTREIPEATAWLTSKNLTEVVRRGTGKDARTLNKPAAGKTGTLPFDVWFAGFTTDRLAVAWIGADRRRRPLGLSYKKNKVYGGDTALPAWLAFMKSADGGRPGKTFESLKPEGIVVAKVDPKSGLLAVKRGKKIPHKAGTEPKERTFDDAAPENITEIEADF